MRIGLEEARQYWAHPSQADRGYTGADLPEWGDYWAEGGVCLMVHQSLWPGVLMAHLGVKPEAWGKAVEPVRRLLGEIMESEKPERIIAWVPESNRAVIALLWRIGAVQDGGMPLQSGAVLQFGWSG